MPYNQRSKESTMRYIAENLDTVRFRVRKGEKEKIEEAAKAAGYLTPTRFIIDAINEKAGGDSPLLTVPQERGRKKKIQENEE